MCGICGIFESDLQKPVELSRIRSMADQLWHRGPDDGGYYTAPGIGLGHRRLSIIDVEGGHQPLANEDESIWVVFNGEIYNFKELNNRFLSNGHRFKTRSDTETIVHLYEELGEECFAQMRGMFAIAIWDGRRKKLLLARDRMGKKPLFYCWNGTRLLFASEIKSLWQSGSISRELDLEALSDYLSFQYVPAPKTIYRTIRKLRPAHYLSVQQNSIREIPYWDLSFAVTEEKTEEQWCESFLDEYRRAIKCRLVSDVPLGAFLSGGVDSSSVVALMKQLQGQVTTCSIGFTEQRYNEATDASDFAKTIDANHHADNVTPQMVSLLPKLAWHYDEPFADSSAIPTYYVSQLARRHVTVALSGDGGDENLAGYRRYKLAMREDQLRSCLPSPFRRAVFGPLGTWYPKLGWAPRVLRAKSTFQSLARSSIEGYFYGVSCCPPDLKRHLLSQDVSASLGSYDSFEVLNQHYLHCDSTDPLSRLQYVDLKTYLADDILVKVDRASMANSLEVRCPLLDHVLIELIAKMPSSLKLRGGQGKYIFKKALATVLPSSILNRPKKGFSVPVSEWLRKDLKDYAHDSLFSAKDNYFSHKSLTRIWNEHQSGHRDWSALLWNVLMFRTWKEACGNV